MSKDKIHIIDTLFSHTHSSSWHNPPTNFEWVREGVYGNDIVFTDTSLSEHVNHDNNNNKFAWLLESPSITESSYDYIKNNHVYFDRVFTFDKELLSISKKFTLVPIGGCWLRECDRKVWDKTKDISIISSDKKQTIGHLLRHEVISTYGIDTYGGGYHPIDNKIMALKDYRFTIAIENCKKDYYFTEKLIDCFMSGTIPVYWGCPSIGDFFDLNGMVLFDGVSELGEVIDSLTEEMYISKMGSVRINYERAKQYLIADDIIYDKIKK